MNRIEVRVLNGGAAEEAERNMVFAARLTQRGHMIKDMDDLTELYERPYGEAVLSAIASLPHPTVQKFAAVNVAVVGASRRFLSQITRHQNEVKFMSASLQYSDYSGRADFAVPYELMEGPEAEREEYLAGCRRSMECYQSLIDAGCGHDAAGYVAPQGLRNVLFISATPYQWKHMIGQRTCRRNTDETRIVMLMIWKELYELSPELFAPGMCGPFCQTGGCLEGKMSCGRPLGPRMTPGDILAEDYPLLVKGGTDEGKTDQLRGAR